MLRVARLESLLADGHRVNSVRPTMVGADVLPSGSLCNAIFIQVDTMIDAEPDNRRLLTHLADGNFHSGEVLGALLGVSRAAVWKRLRRLQESSGLTFERRHGKGYRIDGGIDLLDAAAIRTELDSCSLGEQLELDIHWSIDSTNSYLLEAAQSTNIHGRACLAEQQSAGRGRRGRSWFSPFGSNLYLSLGWSFEEGISALEGLSLAVGVALARTLEQIGIREARLKWPNDLLIDGSKVAGILIETVGDMDSGCQVVIGIGVNVRMPPTADAVIDQSWSDLQRHLAEPLSRNRLAALLLGQLSILLEQFRRQGFAAFTEEWNQRDLCADKTVVIRGLNSTIEGIACGVDGRGGLRVRTAAGIEIIKSGEVSLRML